MKLALITDTHAGARNENEYFNEYFFKFWEGTFFPYIEREKIHHVVHLGDAYDRQKYVTYNIASSWRTRFWNRFRDQKIAIDCIVGNHDAPNNRYSNRPNAFEELTQEYDNVHVFSDPTLNHYDDIPIALIPWINKGNYSQTLEFIDKVPASLAMGHLELKGFEMDKGNVAKHGLDRELFKKFEIVMSGHYHHRSTDGHIWYLGNTYEINWADYMDPRGFHIFDTHTRELQFIPNPHRMHHKVEYNNGEYTTDDDHPLEGELEGKIVRVIVKARDDDSKYKGFIESLQDQKPLKIEVDDQTLVEIESNVQVKDVKNTLSVIHDYIINSDIDDTDKEPIKDIMSELYREAHGTL